MRPGLEHTFEMPFSHNKLIRNPLSLKNKDASYPPCLQSTYHKQQQSKPEPWKLPRKLPSNEIRALVWCQQFPACSITLFEIMLGLVEELGTSATTPKETGMQLVKILVDILKLGGGI